MNFTSHDDYFAHLPKDLHRQAVETATAKGQSLNQWVVDTLSHAVMA